MRRGNFLIVILFAFLSYFALTAFLGHRPWMRYRYGHHRYERCEQDDSSRRNFRNRQSGALPEKRSADSSSFQK